jgi:hypothetical protein
MFKHSVEISDPYDQNDDDYAVQDRLDLSLHGDIPVHEPQQKPCCEDCDEDSAKWHLVLSNHFSDQVQTPR